ncbi:MAG: polyribonucleotide nucleotidyltransferase [Desulfobacteraceae bacterium]|nr:polyribonucleotide nucleotidyltransferase [Desulfobacteraceae bacterium]
MIKTVRTEIGGRELTIECGRLAKQANGSALVTCGETVVLVTATAAKEPRVDIDFFPLTVEYQERLYSVGKIPGSFFRREIGRPSEKETLTSRFIDRPLRPLFAAGYRNETQVIATVLSMDQQNDPDVLAIVGASAALAVSDIPFHGPIAGVRVGLVEGALVLNPTRSQLEKSRLDLIVAGSRQAVVMVEGGADNLSEQEVLDAIYFGFAGLQPLLDLQDELQGAVGKSKMAVSAPVVNEALLSRIIALAKPEMEQVTATADKQERSTRYHELERRVLDELAADETVSLKEAKELLHGLKKTVMRHHIVVNRARIDGRRFDEVRPITSEVGVLPRVHGSALFTRGETQVMVSATLGSGEDEQRVESLYGMAFRPFMLHYNFPPYSVGEVRPLRGPSRRDIGHGALATRAISAALPGHEQFPYTIRVVSEVMESNGSSSMATVCGGILSLMDAGVPIKEPVSGIAMGLIKEGEDIVVLSDILGDEDHLGDMDFKVTGTASGVTALQMDIKIDGVSREIMSQALAQAKDGRLHILGKMHEALAAPRSEISVYAPKVVMMSINPDKIRDLIGPGGKMIKSLTAEYDVKIDVEDNGEVKIFAPNAEVAAQVQARVQGITADPEIGQVYEGPVVKVVDFGAFVQILPGVDGLVHISELEKRRVEKVSDVVKEGDVIKVKVLEIDQRGKIRLSRKALLD